MSTTTATIEPAATEITENGKTYQIRQGMNGGKFFWECGETDCIGFRTLEEAIASAKDHARNPWKPMEPSQRCQSEDEYRDWHHATRP